MSLSLCFVLSVCCGCQSCCHVVSVIGVISFFSVPLVSPASLVSPSPSLCVPRSPSLCLCISLFVSWVCDVLPCLFMHCPNVKFTHPVLGFSVRVTSCFILWVPLLMCIVFSFASPASLCLIYPSYVPMCLHFGVSCHLFLPGTSVHLSPCFRFYILCSYC